jgi:hypothetical protein
MFTEHNCYSKANAKTSRNMTCVLDRSQLRTVKPSPGLPLPLTERPDRGHPTRYCAVGPRRQRLYKWAHVPRFIGESKPYTYSGTDLRRR